MSESSNKALVDHFELMHKILAISCNGTEGQGQANIPKLISSVQMEKESLSEVIAELALKMASVVIRLEGMSCQKQPSNLKALIFSKVTRMKLTFDFIYYLR